MSNIQDAPKTLEVKIRPFANQSTKDRADQNGVSRVLLTSVALSELNLKPGQVCYIWKKDELDRKEAIAWTTTEKNNNKKIIHMSKTFQDLLDFKLSDDLLVSAAGNVKIAEAVVLREITPQHPEEVPELQGEAKSHWEWFLRENLSRSISLASIWFLAL